MTQSTRLAKFPVFPMPAVLLALLAACGGSDDTVPPPAAVSVPFTNGVATTTNPVAYWNRIASDTINQPATPTVGTPEERRPHGQVDLATTHVAIYDAVIAIAGTHMPFATSPTSDPAGASQEAAVAAAAYGVLKALFPSRSAQYQDAYDSFVASIPAGTAKTRGLAVGAEVASKVVALRANDGRSTVATYTPGTGPGEFRGVNPINTHVPYMRPFTLTSAAQFRLPQPPSLGSSAYAADLAEVQALGSATSTQRTAAQLEAARFHTENPGIFLSRNYRSFAMDSRSIADNARLMAMLWVTHGDVGIACFESKYFYNYWRPTSAITLADSDGNPATMADAAWTPVVPTPNHPEYPSAHMCHQGAAAVILREFFGTNQVSFSFSSTVTSTVRNYTTPDDMLTEITLARITGGMHIRTSNVQGGVLGTNVANWIVANHFKPKQ
jgi:hypothetical protein